MKKSSLLAPNLTNAQFLENRNKFKSFRKKLRKKYIKKVGKKAFYSLPAVIKKFSKDPVSLEKFQSLRFLKEINSFCFEETIFDWLNYEAFEIIRRSISLARKLYIEEVNEDILTIIILSNRKKVAENIYYILKKDNLRLPRKKIFKKFCLKYKFNINNVILPISDSDYNLSLFKLLKFLLKVSNISKEKLKTLVLTPEAFFLALLENEKSLVYECFGKLRCQEYRYALIRFLYYEEEKLRTDLKKREYFYDLILKVNAPQQFLGSYPLILDIFDYSTLLAYFRNKLLEFSKIINPKKYNKIQILKSIELNKLKKKKKKLTNKKRNKNT